MCGIFGMISRDGSAHPILSGMSGLLRHRGPDGEGYTLFRADGAMATRGGPDTRAEIYATPTAFSPTGSLDQRDELGVRIALGHRRLAIVDLSPRGHQPMASADVDRLQRGDLQPR